MDIFQEDMGKPDLKTTNLSREDDLYLTQFLVGLVPYGRTSQNSVEAKFVQERTQRHASSYREPSKRLTSPPMNASAIFEVHSKRLLSLTMA